MLALAQKILSALLNGLRHQSCEMTRDTIASGFDHAHWRSTAVQVSTLMPPWTCNWIAFFAEVDRHVCKGVIPISGSKVSKVMWGPSVLNPLPRSFGLLKL